MDVRSISANDRSRFFMQSSNSSTGLVVCFWNAVIAGLNALQKNSSVFKESYIGCCAVKILDCIKKNSP